MIKMINEIYEYNKFIVVYFYRSSNELINVGYFSDPKKLGACTKNSVGMWKIKKLK